jgi:LPXTG-motif cell wall-anchored protein
MKGKYEKMYALTMVAGLILGGNSATVAMAAETMTQPSTIASTEQGQDSSQGDTGVLDSSGEATIQTSQSTTQESEESSTQDSSAVATTDSSTVTSTESSSESTTSSTEATTESSQDDTDKTGQKPTKLTDEDEKEIKKIGKGENFNGKLYLNFVNRKVKEIVDGSLNSSLAIMSIGFFVKDQLKDSNVKERFDVPTETVAHLLSTAILYDIAFAKTSSLLTLMPVANDGTTPTEFVGFYPGTVQYTQTVVNKQDNQMMDIKAYYVDQGSDKTVMIHSGFRGNWDYGTINAEYDDFYNAGYNLLFVDSRATGASGGNYVTYGEYESDDVLHWINKEVSDRPNQKILLYGGSMGAATMMSVLAKDIPSNVKGIIENCGFKSIDEQLRFTYNSSVVPTLGGALPELDLVADKEHEDMYMDLLQQYYFGQELNMNVTENLPEIGMKDDLPKLIIHGSKDSVVPVDNAYALYNLSGGYKDMLIVDGADHGKAQNDDPEAYNQHLTKFLDVVFNDKVYVKYLDENGKSLIDKDELELTGTYGDAYQTEKKAFDGYKLVQIEGTEKGTFNETTPTVTYHYEKIPAQGQVTVRYVDEKNQSLVKDDVVLSGKIGTKYQTDEKSFDGYKLVKVEGDTSGTYAEDAVTVTYHYEKQAKGSNNQTTKDDTKSNGNQSKGTTDGKNLPKTNEVSSLPVTIAGFVVLSIGALFLTLKKRKG